MPVPGAARSRGMAFRSRHEVPAEQRERLQYGAALRGLTALVVPRVAVLDAVRVGERNVHRAGRLALDLIAAGDTGDADADVRIEGVAGRSGHGLRGFA